MALIAGLAAAPVAAEGPWGERLQGEDLRNAFAARTVGLVGDMHVDFKADGALLVGRNWGGWWVEGDRLCLSMSALEPGPIRRGRQCFAVWRDRIDLRFFALDEAGAVATDDFTQARYVDLG